MKLGLIGKNINHSLSPKIHKIIFEELNIEGEYSIFDIESHEIENLLKDCVIEGFKGINVTIPYKVEIMNYLNGVNELVQTIGACNTVLFKDDSLIGFNTDYYGFLSSIERYQIPYNNVKVLILGTGGVSKPVYEFFSKHNENEIYFASRGKKGEKIISYEELNNFKNMDIIVNCTPCGMYPNISESPVSEDVISEFKYAIDLIYNPFETKFLKIAGSLGLICLNGFYMLISQAICAEEIWNDIDINEDIINKIIDRCFNEIL
ncbi:MAG: shikimate dehydrogenase [Oscillospiraceae bacterium]|nr:shikimate dehydrogenase [Oscillospiraceae bacterium]